MKSKEDVHSEGGDKGCREFAKGRAERQRRYSKIDLTRKFNLFKVTLNAQFFYFGAFAIK